VKFLKIAVICPGFKKSNIRKFPWRYIFEISKYLKEEGHDVFFITDVSENDITEFRTIFLRKLFVLFRGETNELLDILDKEQPEKSIMLLGLTSFLRREFKIKNPVYGVFTSPLYTLKELYFNVGLKDLLKYYNYTSIHLLNSLLPDFFVKRYGNYFEKIIFLSEFTKKKLVKKGFPFQKAFVIPAGIDPFFLEKPKTELIRKLRKEVNPHNIPLILYFTSPLPLRGTEILIEAFQEVRKYRNCKLIFLSRLDNNELKKEEFYLLSLAKKKEVQDSVEIISKWAEPSEIKTYLFLADIICLPFKIVISDIPISILEGMSSGKPVISTNIACVSEMISDKGFLVKPNDKKDLSHTINMILNNENNACFLGEKARNYMKTYPNWINIGEEFLNVLNK